MTKRKVRIRMLTSRLELSGSLFDDAEETGEDGECDEEMPEPEDVSEPEEMPEPTEMLMEGRLITGTERVELAYEESELTGMEGSVTAIGFARNTPGLVTMMRTGSVRTALVFEKGKRHICVYHTPFSDFEVCVHTEEVKNELLTRGRMELDYLVEIHGAQAEHCRMTIEIRDDGSAEARELLDEVLRGL